MSRKFSIPAHYRSDLISQLKSYRAKQDSRKKDLEPTVVNLGLLEFRIARHFGFCFGVENAIEIAYRAVQENPGRRVFLLSEMIHNPHVNKDLRDRGVDFLQSTTGETLIPLSQLNSDDVVIVPAFGTTLEMFAKLESIGINPQTYNATCPFVEKVWKRASQLGAQDYSIIIHGKAKHEETRATFSHAKSNAASLVIRDMQEAKLLSLYLKGLKSSQDFYTDFAGLFSEGFDPDKHLKKIGVVNQTTMLATETTEIAELLKQAMIERYGNDQITDHFADTRDTLCYATYENQEAVRALVAAGGDLAIIVGGYNSSNTSHLLEICQEHMPSYFIKDADEIESIDLIRHLDLDSHKVVESNAWLNPQKIQRILISAGASCPDRLVDEVLVRIAALYNLEQNLSEKVSEISNTKIFSDLE